MISPLVATQASTPIASIQQNADAQSILHSQNALHETQEQEREVRENGRAEGRSGILRAKSGCKRKREKNKYQKSLFR